MHRNTLFETIILKVVTTQILSADPPEITQHPKHQSVSPGADVAFTVEATGDDLQFQWQKDGKHIDRDESRLQYSQTDKSSTLHIRCVDRSDNGHYECRVRNAVERNGKTSHTAELTVCEFFLVCICKGFFFVAESKIGLIYRYAWLL